MRQCIRIAPIVAVIGVTILSTPSLVQATDYLIGHQISMSKYAGGQGKLFKLIAKAGTDGNPAAFSLPAAPNGSVVIQRDGGTLTDSLAGGTWKGLGNPAGSKGWKYKNSSAPVGGAVKVLLIKERVVKIVAKGTGTMPAPIAPNGVVSAVVQLGADRYCAEAGTPHDTEVDGKVIKSKQQPPPAACAVICSPPTDADNDSILDCYETDTGVFAGIFDTGTDPNDPDTDDDGIMDGDEVHGTAGGLDLPAMGLSPLRQDILLEYDWFDDSLDCAAHSHQPTDAMLNRVTAMFAAAPVLNPDGSTGINFIHDKGQGGLFTGGNLIPDADGVLTGAVNNAEFQSHKAANFAANREDYFHYVILPHRYNTNSTSSGFAEIFGDDMIVSLYCAYANTQIVSNTIAHELGHNLGLFHGGNDNCNFKPNYNSVMNYLYQFAGVDSDCTPPANGVLDYSIGDRLTLDENDLDENLGVCGAPAWDWNGNTVIESGISWDINFLDGEQMIWCGGVLSVLDDFDDWANISLPSLADADGAVPRSSNEVIDCDNPVPGF
jgi:hypothetical protein